MEVKLNTAVNQVSPPAASGQPKKAVTQARPDAAFEGTAALNKALEQTPEVRADVVARAKALVESPSYPPLETINKVAALLGLNLDETNQK